MQTLERFLASLIIDDLSAKKSFLASIYASYSGSNNTAGVGPGYDFVTGLGSPLANSLVPDLKKYE
jgi:hypothetical protein